MTTALAVLRKNRNVLLTDFILLAALYLLPSISHMLALPLYKLEPMRIAVIVALLFTNRKNTYLVALTVPLASAWITGHPEPVKAVLIGIELATLVAAYGYFVRIDRIPAFAAMAVAIVFSKSVYYAMKFFTLSIGLLGGSLVSTPLQSQLLLAVGTVLAFGVIEHYRDRPTERQE